MIERPLAENGFPEFRSFVSLRLALIVYFNEFMTWWFQHSAARINVYCDVRGRLKDQSDAAAPAPAAYSVCLRFTLVHANIRTSHYRRLPFALATRSQSHETTRRSFLDPVSAVNMQYIPAVFEHEVITGLVQVEQACIQAPEAMQVGDEPRRMHAQSTSSVTAPRDGMCKFHNHARLCLCSIAFRNVKILTNRYGL